MEKQVYQNPIADKTFQFALRIMEFSEELEMKRKRRFADQILRSGTSIGANVREAQMAETKKDFLHKMSIAAKEGEETEYWLTLCKHAKSYPDPADLLEECQEVNKILNKIVKTTKSNLKTSASSR